VHRPLLPFFALVAPVGSNSAGGKKSGGSNNGGIALIGCWFAFVCDPGESSAVQGGKHSLKYAGRQFRVSAKSSGAQTGLGQYFQIVLGDRRPRDVSESLEKGGIGSDFNALTVELHKAERCIEETFDRGPVLVECSRVRFKGFLQPFLTEEFSRF
jgi:hypothetical protein